jgi:hypothetical protein
VFQGTCSDDVFSNSTVLPVEAHGGYGDDTLISVRPKMRFGLEFAGVCAKMLLEE